jgi:serine/threonine-protein kinase HipA
VTELASVDELRVHYHRTPGERCLAGRLVYRNRRAIFEYDPTFRSTGLELSPFKMKLREGLLSASPDKFEGLFGLFDDSLPDGWGRLLLDRHIATQGVPPERLTPLDRLAWVGTRAIGALSYEPAHHLEQHDDIDLHLLGEEMQIVLEDRASDAIEKLLSLGGSPQGARPKALVLVSEDGDRVVAGSEHRDGFDPYLVKFRAKGDPHDAAGAIEFAYSQMARAAGVTMPRTRLLAPKGEHRGFFAIARFDRRGRQRLHTHTVSGLLEAPPGQSLLSYEQLLKATSVLTRDARDVKQMYRRAAFNVFAHNRDDHARNFAFMMEGDGRWTLAPAYDLTFCHGPGGEHTMLVGHEGRSPGRRDLLELARTASINATEAQAIIAEVRAACVRWPEFADEGGVPDQERDRVQASLKRLTD